MIKKKKQCKVPTESTAVWLNGYSFSCVMFNILEEFCIFASSFYDGCIIFIKRADHIRHVKTIIDKFAKFGIQIIFWKCQFVEEEV